MSLCNDITIMRFLEREIERVPVQHRGLLLDLGCGAQQYRPIYVNTFKRVVAADYNTRSRLDVRLNVCQLPFRSSSVDVVLFTEVIEHVIDGAQALREIGRVLKPGGVLLITWPLIYPLHELPHDYVRYTEFAMDRLAYQAGLQITVLQRRGDIFCIGASLVEQLILSTIELMARCQWVGRTFRPLLPLFQNISRVLWLMYFEWNAEAPHLHPNRPGANLKGLINHMGLWTMGYCARITKLEVDT